MNTLTQWFTSTFPPYKTKKVRTRVEDDKEIVTLRLVFPWYTKLRPSNLSTLVEPWRFRLGQWLIHSPNYRNYPADLITHIPQLPGERFGSKPRIPSPEEIISLGFQYTWKGRLCRVAVKLHAAPSPAELLRAWELLAKAMIDPEAPGSGAAFDLDELLPRTMDATIEPAN